MADSSVPGVNVPGALVLGDSEPLVMTAGDRAADPTRHAWVTTLLLPTGLIAAAVG